MRNRTARAGTGAVIFTFGALIFSFDVWSGDGRIRAHPLSTPTGSPTISVSVGQSLARGKEIFVVRCAGCHNEGGDKPLPDGPPLDRRLIPPDKLLKSVSGRLSGATDAEKRAVAAYIRSFMKTGGDL
jgi:mono/diheme cytochrome c family protein